MNRLLLSRTLKNTYKVIGFFSRQKKKSNAQVNHDDRNKIIYIYIYISNNYPRNELNRYLYQPPNIIQEACTIL